MTKSEARTALRAEILKRTKQVSEETVREDGFVSFGWCVRESYVPLCEGDWRSETAKVKKIQIELDQLAKFEDYPLDSLDRFTMPRHLGDLAERMSQDRVKQARSYLMSIFDEAIEQEFLLKDPSRKLKAPRISERRTSKFSIGNRSGKRSISWAEETDFL
jgi:hypothetical protein